MCDEIKVKFPNLVKIWNRRKQVIFENANGVNVLVIAGHVREFDAHIWELIEAYHDVAYRIIYITRDDQIAGIPNAVFEEVGNYWNSQAWKSHHWQEYKRYRSMKCQCCHSKTREGSALCDDCTKLIRV